MTKTIFLDMDLTVVKFIKKHGEQGTKKYKTEMGFFRKLKPYSNIDEVNNAIQENTENIYILSNSPNKIADSDKIGWLNQYLPAILEENKIFNRGGLYADRTKADVAMEFLERGLTKNDILIDDCPKNCKEWEQAGGKAIRKRGKNDGIEWSGESIYTMKNLAKLIKTA